MTQAEVSARTGIPVITIKLWEGSKRVPRLDSFLKLCEGLGTDPMYFLANG